MTESNLSCEATNKINKTITTDSIIDSSTASLIPNEDKGNNSVNHSHDSNKPEHINEKGFGKRRRIPNSKYDDGIGDGIGDFEDYNFPTDSTDGLLSPSQGGQMRTPNNMKANKQASHKKGFQGQDDDEEEDDEDEGGVINRDNEKGEGGRGASYHEVLSSSSSSLSKTKDKKSKSSFDQASSMKSPKTNNQKNHKITSFDKTKPSYQMSYGGDHLSLKQQQQVRDAYIAEKVTTALLKTLQIKGPLTATQCCEALNSKRKHHVDEISLQTVRSVLSLLTATPLVNKVPSSIIFGDDTEEGEVKLTSTRGRKRKGNKTSSSVKKNNKNNHHHIQQKEKEENENGDNAVDDNEIEDNGMCYVFCQSTVPLKQANASTSSSSSTDGSTSSTSTWSHKEPLPDVATTLTEVMKGKRSVADLKERIQLIQTELNSSKEHSVKTLQAFLESTLSTRRELFDNSLHPKHTDLMYRRACRVARLPLETRLLNATSLFDGMELIRDVKPDKEPFQYDIELLQHVLTHNYNIETHIEPGGLSYAKTSTSSSTSTSTASPYNKVFSESSTTKSLKSSSSLNNNTRKMKCDSTDPLDDSTDLLRNKSNKSLAPSAYSAWCREGMLVRHKSGKEGYIMRLKGPWIEVKFIDSKTSCATRVSDLQPLNHHPEDGDNPVDS